MTLHDLDAKHDRVCTNCELRSLMESGRAHRSIDQLCPGHEGFMDWSLSGGTVFEDSGRTQGLRPSGTPAKNGKHPVFMVDLDTNLLHICRPGSTVAAECGARPTSYRSSATAHLVAREPHNPCPTCLPYNDEEPEND